ncbi:MAG TPA: DUF692 domain-containing protein [Pseudomonadales bacterium]|nr:DUF692 domain-containing protein [Pseudomonadales bacterium]
MLHQTLQGAGLGLRRAHIQELSLNIPAAIDFFELAPENWIQIGGRLGKQLRTVSEQRPLVAHGLSLSLGGTQPLDFELLHNIKHFLNEHQVQLYSEHLSYCFDGGHLYDLLPLPFTEEAVKHVAQRIRQVQDFLERRIAIENVSYYLCLQNDLSEATFITAVLQEADCDLLLDINNVYVNSVNHAYDARNFLQQMPAERIRYLHMAGHYVEEDGFIIDTHGAEVVDPVWQLLSETYARLGPRPTLLERDFNLPTLSQLSLELEQIKTLQQQVTAHDHARIDAA